MRLRGRDIKSDPIPPTHQTKFIHSSGGMSGRPRGVLSRHVFFFTGVCVLTSVLLIFAWLKLYAKDICVVVESAFQQPEVMVPSEVYVTDYIGQKYAYNTNMPLIFIGGMPRSGTTLLRVLLDAHPEVRCGEETRIIPRLIGLKNQWMNTALESRRLMEAGISAQVLDRAVAAFTLEIIARHGEPAPRLCNKDPFTLRSSIYLNKLFPRAKFILMLRDGRAVVHSIISRKVTITGMDLRDYRQCLHRWNAAVQAMYRQCHILGPQVCLPVHYERLVLHPELSMRKILAFLDLPWNNSVLHHELLVGKKGGVTLSILERSTDQVMRPINTEPLTKWVGHFPLDVVKDMPSIAPMLLALGYDPRANPPHYGEPDSMVMKNTGDLVANKKFWEARERMVAEKREKIWKSWIKNSRTTLPKEFQQNLQEFKDLARNDSGRPPDFDLTDNILHVT